MNGRFKDNRCPPRKKKISDLSMLHVVRERAEIGTQVFLALRLYT